MKFGSLWIAYLDLFSISIAASMFLYAMLLILNNNKENIFSYLQI